MSSDTCPICQLGEVVIFDRSWYNRAGVERVMGFCSEKDAKRFLSIAPYVERTFVESGIILLKYWLEVSPEEQKKRLKARIDDGRKTWKLSKMDLKSFTRWDDYARAMRCSWRRIPRGHSGSLCYPMT
jgi:polyphosphate kinase 2 (PPK2 family)